MLRFLIPKRVLKGFIDEGDYRNWSFKKSLEGFYEV